MVGYIRLIPNMYDAGFVGTLFLISYKYCEITNINVVINMFYFKVNYLIIIIATFGVLINNFLISRSNDK